METSVEQRGDVITVRIAGSVDGLTAEDLQQIFSAEVEAGHHNLVADFGEVEYTGSAGLRVLLGTMKHARSSGGDLRLAAPRPEVLKVLDLSGFTSILKVFDTVDDAVASFE
ncbi:MAG: STAS domain-containing protein [Gemmatimonadales bacterium]|jgi:anti-anti-sigma factor